MTGVAVTAQREAILVTMNSQIESPPPPAEAVTAEPSEAVAAILTGASESARHAIVEFSGDTVGEYLGVTFEDDSAATHRFLAKLPGYQGWQWAAVVAAHPGAEHATISEVVLIPGPTALLAPSWVPWENRVRAGDLGPGDLLAPQPGDLRLVPGYTATGDPAFDDLALEVGLGRRQVLSPFGRADAAERWHDGDHGPGAPMARATKRACRDCGFMVPLAGVLGTMFGVCCNELSADGHVVDFDSGCGAHSDTPAPAGAGSPMYEPYDDGVVEVVAAEPVAAATEAVEVEVVEADVATTEGGGAEAPDAEPTDAALTDAALTEPARTDADESADAVEPFEPADTVEPADTEPVEPSET